MSPRLISHRFPTEELGIRTIEVKGGCDDGTIYTFVYAMGDDGAEWGAWICNVRPGYFKQAFVSFDFELPP